MKIATLGLNERAYIGRTQREMLDYCRNRCLDLKSLSPDMIVFPEIVFIMYPEKEPLSYGEFFEMALAEMKDTARLVNSYLVFNLYEPAEESEKRYIATYVLNRNGEVAGKYRKIYPTKGEMASGVVPGDLPCVIDTEFGRIGIATCFDIGFRSYWQSLADLGAKAVIWTSAYDGGKLLDAYAVLHSYWVISSVRTYRARIIDPAGRTVSESARWDDLCMADIDLDMELFHIDDQIPKIREIRRVLGDKVKVDTLSEDNIFTVSSRDSEWSVERVKSEFGLVSYKEYHKEAELLRK